MEEPVSQLASALAKAQAEIKAPIKNCHVDYTHNGQRTKYSYADLAGIMAAVLPATSKHGLAIVHRIVQGQSDFGLETMLMHSSGESLTSYYPLPHPTNVKPQQFGSSYTYARRYSICGLLAIAAEDDDDGAAAEPPKPAIKNYAPQSSSMANPLNEPREVTENRERNERDGYQNIAKPSLAKDEYDKLKSSKGTIAVTKIVQAQVEKESTGGPLCSGQGEPEVGDPGPLSAPPSDFNELDAALAGNSVTSPLDYKITFGKYVGKTIRQVGVNTIKEYVNYMMSKADATNGPSPSLTKLDEMIRQC